MEELNIQTIINCRRRVFDRSGKLPFTLVFGLCRRSIEDSDPRTIALSTAKTFLDVPYAFSHGLLTLSVSDAESKNYTEIEARHLSQDPSQEDSHVTLSSPVGRKENWRKALVVYHYHIDPESELGSKFEAGKTYSIRIKAGQHLDRENYKFLNEHVSPEEKQQAQTSIKEPRLVLRKPHGRAQFPVVPSLIWPPELQTTMKLCKGEEGSGKFLLDVTVLNTGTEAIVIQTRGQQRFVAPIGPMGEDEDIPIDSGRPRIIDSAHPSAIASIQVLDTVTNAIVYRPTHSNICSVHSYENYDPRSRLETMVTLKPGEPLIRRIELEKLLSKIPDGAYCLRLEPRGMWWCTGTVEDFVAEGEDRVPHRLWKTDIPPAMLECTEDVEIQVKDGAAA